MAFSDRTPGVLGTWFFFSTLSFFSGHSEFKLLMRDVISSKRQAYANGTYSNLNTQFRSYFSYCIYFKRNPLPADADTICGYAQFLGRSLQPGAISNYLSGVRTLHSRAFTTTSLRTSICSLSSKEYQGSSLMFLVAPARLLHRF